MGSKRVGMSLFGVGLLAFSLGYVYPVGECTELACPAADPAFVVLGFDWSTLGLVYFDGCNTCASPLLGVGLLLLALGVVVGGVGVGRDLLNPE